MKIGILACLLVITAITIGAVKNGFNPNKVLSAKALGYNGPN